ncbi:MAG: methylmalonyl-CoA epimerase, partial [Bacteroidota bacterium]
MDAFNWLKSRLAIIKAQPSPPPTRSLFMHLDHIGIAVADLEATNELMKRLLGRAHYKIEDIQEQGVSTSFFTAGETGEAKVELVGGIRAGNAIDKFISKRGQGLHHLAFKVDDIEAELERLEAAGFELLAGYPSIGADNMRVAFLHPRSTAGVLVEICQPIEAGKV